MREPQTEIQDRNPGLLVRVYAIIERLAFVRGALAALSLLGLVVGFTDFSNYEALRIIRAMILSWNEILSPVAEMLSRIPFISVDVIVINTLLLVLALMPGLFKLIERRFIRADRKSIDALIFLVMLLCLPLLGLGLLFPENRIIRIPVLLIMIIFVGALLYGQRYRPRFRAGVVMILGFLVTVEALYHLNTPGIVDWLEQIAEQSLGPK